MARRGNLTLAEAILLQGRGQNNLGTVFGQYVAGHDKRLEEGRERNRQKALEAALKGIHEGRDKWSPSVSMALSQAGLPEQALEMALAQRQGGAPTILDAGDIMVDSMGRTIAQNPKAQNEKRTSDMIEFAAMYPDLKPGSPEFREAFKAHKLMKAPRTEVNIDNRPKPPSGFEWTEDGSGLRPIPGGPADNMTPDQAGRAAMVEDMGRNLETLAETLIQEDGSIDRAAVAQMHVPFTEGVGQGRLARVALLNTIETRLRLETGAAAPDTEVQRLFKRFEPKLVDSDEVIKYKIETMNGFLRDVRKFMRPDKGLDFDAMHAEIDKKLGGVEVSDEDKVKSIMSKYKK